jgi:hypothetical protein
LARLAKREERLVPIGRFLEDAVFGPELVSAMGRAFEDVGAALDAAGRSDVAKETVADMIIHLARRGETDPIVLRDKVLSELGLSRKEP